MSDRIRVFLGSDNYGADFPELEVLRKKSEKEGFHGYRNNISLEEDFGRFKMPGKKATVRGGYAGYCVAHTVDYLLDVDVDEVEVDLPNCRCSEDDKGVSRDAIERRKTDVILGMEIGHRTDKRVRFIEQ